MIFEGHKNNLDYLSTTINTYVYNFPSNMSSLRRLTQFQSAVTMYRLEPWCRVHRGFLSDRGRTHRIARRPSPRLQSSICFGCVITFQKSFSGAFLGCQCTAITIIGVPSTRECKCCYVQRACLSPNEHAQDKLFFAAPSRVGIGTAEQNNTAQFARTQILSELRQNLCVKEWAAKLVSGQANGFRVILIALTTPVLLFHSP